MAVSLARDLSRHQSPKPREIDSAADAKSQLEALSRRLEAAEAAGAEQAKLVKMLADELEALARRAVVGWWVGIAGLVIALGALGVAVFR